VESSQASSTVDHWSPDNIGQGVFVNPIASMNRLATSKVAFCCWGTFWSELALGCGAFWTALDFDCGSAWADSSACSDSDYLLRKVDFWRLSSSSAIDPGASATTLVSVWNTWVFRMALTALKEPRTLWQRITLFPSPWRRLASHTYLLYFAPGYTPSERHMCYTLPRDCSYAVAVYTTPDDVYAFFQPRATFYLSTIAIYRMPHSLHVCLALRSCH